MRHLPSANIVGARCKIHGPLDTVKLKYRNNVYSWGEQKNNNNIKRG